MFKATFGICLLPILVPAASLPTGFTESSITGISSPTAMTFAPDGRLLVCQQGGDLRLIRNGILSQTPFLTVPATSEGERGLLGVAVAGGFVYVYYTATSPTIHNRLSRFPDDGGDVANGPEQVLADFENLNATDHNGGAVHVSPADGKVYVAMGDNANSAASQQLTNRLGKVHRYNPDGSIPADNPFFNVATGVNRSIYVMGLRNPFTFAFQPGTGRMFINDVGESTWEEINEGAPGANYGWPASEGPQNTSGFTAPLYYYRHTSGAGPEFGCAITGGTFYDPVVNNFPAEYVGQYFFADLCQGFIRRLNVTSGPPYTTTGFATGISSPVDLAVGPDGKLYYLARGSGAVFVVEFTGGSAPTITQDPQSITVSVGQPAMFTVAASGAEPLSYQWQRNTVNVPAATSASYTIPSVTLNDNGDQFRAVVSNSSGSATSNSATLTVTSDQPPIVTITAPAAGSLYTAGTQVAFAGTATDPEDGNIPASNFCWQVDFHHDDHVHPFFPETCAITSGVVNIPNTGETSTNVWYRFYLRVRDSSNNLTEKFVDVFPRVVTLTLNTAPVALQLTLDGQPVTSPNTFTSVVGILRSIGAITPQTVGNTTYQFTSWSDNGAATHAITTPGSNTTYTATFTAETGCTYSLSTTSGSFSSAGDLVRVKVTAPEGCAWTAVSNVSWVTFPSGNVGNGRGVLVFLVAPNTGVRLRTTTLLIAGIPFEVTQNGIAKITFSQP